jgi:hypothetical protein
MRARTSAACLGIVAVLLGGAGTAPSGAETADDSNVHGCAITMRAIGGVGVDLRRYTDVWMAGAESEACGALRVSLTVFTNENGTLRRSTTNVDQANYGPPFPENSFIYETWAHGSFRYARAHFSWCADGGDSCATRVRTRATMYKGGAIAFG